MSNLPPPPSGGGFPPPGGPPPGGPPPGGEFPPPGGGFPPPGGGPPGAPGPLAEWQDRLISGLIDWVGPILVANVLSFVVGLAIAASNTNTFFNPTGIVLNLVAVAWILYNGYLAGESGQSIGMKQSGLRLVGEQSGQNIGGGQGVVRNLLFLANAICCLFLPVVIVDALFPLWDPKKQTLRDKITKSVVVKG